MKINNVELNVQVSGDGIPFLWAHGLMGTMALEDSANWFQWDGLSEQVKLIRYDARGHGQSEGTLEPQDYHWSELAKDMIAIADSLDLDTFVAGGQSMGCATALYAALLAPERVSGLVLVNPPTAWETRAAQSAIYDQLAALVETQGVAVLVGLMQQQPLLPAWLLEAQPEIGEGYLRVVQAFDPQILPQILRGAKLCDLAPRSELETLGMPALILPWVDDATHPLATAEELDALLPESSMVIAADLDDVGSWSGLMGTFITDLA